MALSAVSVSTLPAPNSPLCHLSGVVEVYRVTKRVELGIKATAVCSEKLQQLLKDIDKVWNNLIGFMSLATLTVSLSDSPAVAFLSETRVLKQSVCSCYGTHGRMRCLPRRVMLKEGAGTGQIR